jgi:hypothetical protein
MEPQPPAEVLSSAKEVAMTKRMPPIPPASRPKKGPDKPPRRDNDPKTGEPVPENLSEQGHQGNIYQNTHNQGYQQDR